jgi:hypothetical protein
MRSESTIGAPPAAATGLGEVGTSHMGTNNPMPEIDNDPTPENPTPDPVQVPPAPYEESPSSTGVTTGGPDEDDA